MIDVAVGRHSPGYRKVFSRIVSSRIRSRKDFRIEVWTGDRAVGPAAAGLAMVEPYTDTAGARINGVLRECIVEGCRELVGWLELQHGLAVDAFTIDVGEVVSCVLRDLIDIVAFGTVFDVIETWVARHRERAPVSFGGEIAFAPFTDRELRQARLAALI